MRNDPVKIGEFRPSTTISASPKRLQYDYSLWLGLFGVTPHLSRSNLTNKICRNKRELNLSEFMVFSFHQNPQPLRHKHNDNPKSTASINLISWVKLILAGHLQQRHISPKSMTQFTRETYTPTLSTWANDWQWKEPMMVASKATTPPRLRTLRRFIHDPSWIKGSKTLFTSSNNLQRLEASCMINHFLLEVGRTPVKSALECKHV